MRTRELIHNAISIHDKIESTALV